MLRSLYLLMSLVLSLSVSASGNLTALQDKGIHKWAPKIFSGQSVYRVEEYKGRIALQAVSDKTASGLVLEKRIDLSLTPYLNWSWLVEKQLIGLNERSKQGDDFVARIYLVIDGGLIFWRTKSLNYVWSSNQVKGLIWDNAYAGSNVRMMSVRGNESNTSQWYEEKRNVYNDLIQAFGDKGSDEKNKKAYQYIDVIAIMTDTDNSGKQAESYYGDIIFTEY